MYYKYMILNMFMIFFLIPSSAFAATHVVEGKEAEALLEQQKTFSNILVQLNKVFVLQTPDGLRKEQPEEVTIEVGEYIFITNEEHGIVHNVYDQTDHSWVLKKQLPTGVAAIKFDEVKTHKLRCAIHPTMKITVNVVEKGQKETKEKTSTGMQE